MFAVLSLPLRAERLPLKPFTTPDGLAHNAVNKIVRDSRGFLWFCTGEGLSRFDGYAFTNYRTDHGLPHPRVNDFLETRGGDIWIATNAGLVLFDPRGVPAGRVVYAGEPHDGPPPMFTTVVPEDEDRRARAVSVLLEGRDGTIWAGTQQGVHRLERSNGHLRLTHVDLKWPGEVRGSIWDLLEDRHGSLWIAYLGALCRRWPDGSTAHYTMRDGLPDNDFHELFEDRRGQLWAGTREHGFFRFTADETHAPPVVAFTLTVRDLGQSDWINQLFETSDHRFWAATANGLIEFFPDGDEQGRRYRLYTTNNGLSGDAITALNEDMSGNLWLGCESGAGSDGGAMKLARDGLISYGERDGLLVVYAIFGDRTGGVCFRGQLFGDERRSAFEGEKSDRLRRVENSPPRYGRFDGERFTWLEPDALGSDQLGWVGNMVTLQARNGEWWLGTGIGVYRFPATDDFASLKRARPLAVYTTKDGLTGPQVFRLFEDSRGDIWVSAIQPNGWARWQRAGETWHDLTNAPELPRPKDDLARSFGEDRDGNVWVGFSSGVARYRQGRFAFFDADDGLPPGAVETIYLDGAGRLWLASSRSGLVRVDAPGAEYPVFRVYTTAQGLSSNTAQGITEDLRGHIYVGTGRGLDRLDPATGHVKHFTPADGLAPGWILAAFRDRDGTLWFGTAKGLSRFVPEAQAPAAAPPPILITALSVAGERQTVSAQGEMALALPDLAPDRNQLQIDFVGLSFAPGEVLRYQYQLEGSDPDWHVPTEQRAVNYASLAPGRYRFLVRAVNSDGVASSTPATITFTVLPPIWQRPWFLLLVAIAAAAGIYSLYRYRVRRLVELERVRTRIATDLHDDIGANLTRIAILSEVAHQRLGHVSSKEDDLLPSIAEISRESVSAMGDIVWAINPKKDTLADLTRRMRQHAREILERREIRFHFNGADRSPELRLDANTRRTVYLIFKEALNNIVRHARASVVRVELKILNSEFVMSIADDGVGFDTRHEYEGNGVLSMKRRAEEAGGRLEVTSAAGEGTRVLMHLPL